MDNNSSNLPDPGLTDSHRLIRIETLLLGMSNSNQDHENRIRRLERVLYIGIGVAASLGSAVGSYVGQVTP